MWATIVRITLGCFCDCLELGKSGFLPATCMPPNLYVLSCPLAINVICPINIILPPNTFMQNDESSFFSWSKYEDLLLLLLFSNFFCPVVFWKHYNLKPSYSPRGTEPPFLGCAVSLH